MYELPSSASTMDIPEIEVILDRRASVRSPTEMSVSAMEMADWRIVSGRLWRLSDAVTVLRKLEAGGVVDVLATDDGLSLGGGGGLRRKIEVFRDTTFDGLDVVELSPS